MNTFKTICMAVLALAMAACTNDEAATSSQPAADGTAAGRGIPFSATVTTGATTRAVTENTAGQKLETAWTVGEQVALIHNSVMDVMKVSEIDEETQTATITGTVTGSPSDGDEVTVVYPASAVDESTKAVKAGLLAAQDGTLATISRDLDLCQSSGTKLKVGAGIASLDGTVKLVPQVAIVKFSLSDGTAPLATKSFVIKDGSDNVITTVTPASDQSDLFVAMAPATGAAYSFSAVVNDFYWLYSKTGVTLKAGTYYKSPITLTILKKAGEISYAVATVNKTYGDGNFTNELTKTGDGTVTYESSNTAVAEVDSKTGEVTIKGNGETTIKATVADGPTYTYATTEAAYTLTVAKAAMTVTATGFSGTYDGKAHGITVNVTSPSGATIKYGTSATSCNQASLTYTNVGTYTVYYEVTKDNYNTVTGSATVTINKATMTVTASDVSCTYDGKAHGITVNVTSPTGATIKYGTSAGTYDKTSSPTYTKAGTYTVYYEVTKDNYTPVTGSVVVTINKAAGEIKFTETSVMKNYGDVAFINDTFSIIGDGVVTYTSSDTSVASVSNVSPTNGQVSILGTGTATITATVADSENYTYAKKTAEYTIVVKPQVNGRDPFDVGTDPFN